jgi:tetratricopeptide (TPR) repeat protein
MSASPDYYEVLQVSPHAETEVIEAAYKRLVEKWQAGRRPGDPAAFARLALLDEAYTALSDPRGREEYDRLRGQPAESPLPREERSQAVVDMGKDANEPALSVPDLVSPPAPNAGPLQTVAPPAAGEAPRCAAVVSPTAWTMFALGGVLFLLQQSIDAASFLARGVIWGAIFGGAAYLCAKRRDRISMTVVALLFLAAAGLDVAAAEYSRRVRRAVNEPPHTRIEGAQLEGGNVSLAPKTGSTTSEEARALIKTGLTAQRDGRLDEAIKGFDAAIRLDPNSSEAFRLRGEARTWMADFGAAIPDFSEAIRLNPQDGKAYRERGSAWYFKGEPERAIRDLTEAIRLNPEDSEAHRLRGDAWVSAGEYGRAFQDLDEAIRLNRTGAASYVSRAIALIQKQDYDRAIEDCDAAIKLDPKQPVTYFYRGNAWLAKGDEDKAIASFDEAIRLGPVPGAHRARADVWFGKQQFLKAARDYSDALRVNSMDGISFRGRGKTRCLLRRYDEAVEDLSAAIRLNPRDSEAYAWRGDAWSNKNESDKAMADFDEAIRLDPTNSEAYRWRAHSRARAGQWPKAISDHEKAIEHHSRPFAACLDLAWLLATCPDMSVRDGKRAVRLATRARELGINGVVWDVVAAAFAEDGRFDEAMNYETKALADQSIPPDMRDRYLKRLELYKKKQPYRFSEYPGR